MFIGVLCETVQMFASKYLHIYGKCNHNKITKIREESWYERLSKFPWCLIIVTLLFVLAITCSMVFITQKVWFSFEVKLVVKSVKALFTKCMFSACFPHAWVSSSVLWFLHTIQRNAFRLLSDSNLAIGMAILALHFQVYTENCGPTKIL